MMSEERRCDMNNKIIAIAGLALVTCTLGTGCVAYRCADATDPLYVYDTTPATTLGTTVITTETVPGYNTFYDMTYVEPIYWHSYTARRHPEPRYHRPPPPPHQMTGTRVRHEQKNPRPAARPATAARPAARPTTTTRPATRPTTTTRPATRPATTRPATTRPATRPAARPAGGGRGHRR